MTHDLSAKVDLILSSHLNSVHISIKWQSNTVFLKMVRVHHIDYMDF